MPRHVADTDGGLGALLDYDKQASRAKRYTHRQSGGLP